MIGLTYLSTLYLISTFKVLTLINLTCQIYRTNTVFRVLHFVFSSLVPRVRSTNTVRVSRNDKPRDWVPIENPELPDDEPFELMIDPDDPVPPPQSPKIRSAMEQGTPSPKMSRTNSCRFTHPDGADKRRKASWRRRRSASVTETTLKRHVK